MCGELNQNEDFQIEVNVIDKSNLEITVMNHTDGYIELQPCDYLPRYEEETWVEVYSNSMSDGDVSGEFIGVKENSSVS